MLPRQVRSGEAIVACHILCANSILSLFQLLEYFHYAAGMDKLTRPRPTTAIFGNWGILQAVRRMTDADADVDVSARLFMGRKVSSGVPDVPLSAKVCPLSRGEDAFVVRQRAQLRQACTSYEGVHVI